MPTSDANYVVETRDLYFYYLSPRKVRTHRFIPIPKIEFRKVVALDGVSISLRKGETTALLGRNGSGKTTLIKLLLGARYPHSGELFVFGDSPSQSKGNIGVCLGATLIYNRLSGRENLEYFGRLYNVSKLEQRIADLANLLTLEDTLDNLVETYSFGMKAKLAIARAMIHSPELLILDEPTLGIDIPLALQIRKLIKSLSCTILLTTHYMEEAEMLSDNLCIIDKGRILTSGTKAEVLAGAGVQTVSDAFMHYVEGPSSLVKPQLVSAR
jgi:ABC-type multidrug transport system ATPase subunit